jgi:hypothetical protein
VRRLGRLFAGAALAGALALGPLVVDNRAWAAG